MPNPNEEYELFIKDREKLREIHTKLSTTQKFLQAYVEYDSLQIVKSLHNANKREQKKKYNKLIVNAHILNLVGDVNNAIERLNNKIENYKELLQ